MIGEHMHLYVGSIVHGLDQAKAVELAESLPPSAVIEMPDMMNEQLGWQGNFSVFFLTSEQPNAKEEFFSPWLWACRLICYPAHEP